MNAQTPFASAAVETASQAVPAAAALDPDALLTEFTNEAKAIASSTTKIAAVDALKARFIASPLPEYTFKPFATVLAEAAGIDRDTILKDMLKVRRKEAAAAEQATGTDAGFLSDPTPASNPPTLNELLGAIQKLIRIRVHCSIEAATAVALWIIGTWGLHPPSETVRGPDRFPRLHIFAPVKRSGKSLLLEIVEFLSRRALAAQDISLSAMFRSIERWCPTLVMDEVDQLFRVNKDLTGIVNSGYTRNGRVIRNVETEAGGRRDFDPTPFSTFAAVAMAGIGRLPGTIEDRSIRIAMQRQTPSGLRRITLTQLEGHRARLGPMLMAYADIIGAAMAAGVPDNLMPAALGARDADNWRPLLGVAQAAGGTWLAEAQRAALATCEAPTDGDRAPEWLLRVVAEYIADVRRPAAAALRTWRRAPTGTRPSVPPSARFLPSDELAAALLERDDSGFSDLRDMGAVKLAVARRLKPFHVEPRQQRVGAKVTRGYDVRELRAVARRYR